MVWDTSAGIGMAVRISGASVALRGLAAGRIWVDE